MTIEKQYLATLDLTHQMLEAAVTQDWNTLVKIETQRARIVESIAKQTTPLLSHTEKSRIAGIIAEIEREGAEIMERVQCWQEHARILLRMKKHEAILTRMEEPTHPS